MDNKEIATEFAELIKSKYGSQIEDVILFGSVVRDEATDESDIDLMVICQGDRFKLRRKIMAEVFTYLLKYKVYISVKTLSSQDRINLQNSGIMKNIAREGVVLG